MMMRTLTALLAVALAATPAVAGPAFDCDNGTTLEYDTDRRELVIDGLFEGFAFILPYGHYGDGYKVFTPASYQATRNGCEYNTAPCAELWPSTGGAPASVFYILNDGDTPVVCLSESSPS